MKKILLVLICFFVVGCNNDNLQPEICHHTSEYLNADSNFDETDEITNYIKIEMDNDDVIIIELYPECAPITVENFQNLVSREFFDGTNFHRVVAGFMIQGGSSATGDAANTIIGEFANNGIDNPILHERGVISMARTPDMNSASSQFFIMHAANVGLDEDYAAFGRVIFGMDTVDRIATTPVDDPASMSPSPITPQVVRSIRFVTIER